MLQQLRIQESWKWMTWCFSILIIYLKLLGAPLGLARPMLTLKLTVKNNQILL